jgi:hypothetical protein
VSVSCAHCAGLRWMPRTDSRVWSRRQRTQGSEFCPMGHPREYRGQHLATDNVLRNDSRHARRCSVWLEIDVASFWGRLGEFLLDPVHFVADGIGDLASELN